VHRGQTRLSDGAAFIEHPCEVALLLHASGAPDALVAAGLLHDTLERTAATPSDLALRLALRSRRWWPR
jgi:(p)ppGpp synthase/HD superfamily hydrolase